MMEAIQKFTELKRKKRNKVTDSSEEELEVDIKKAMLKNDPAQATRLQLEKMFEKVEEPVQLADTRPVFIPPKDFIYNVPGAVTGSSADYAYRHARRTEYNRIKTIEHEELVEKQRNDFQKEIERKQKIADERTAKKREKRKKKRAPKGKKSKQAESGSE